MISLHFSVISLPVDDFPTFFGDFPTCFGDFPTLGQFSFGDFPTFVF